MKTFGIKSLLSSVPLLAALGGFANGCADQGAEAPSAPAGVGTEEAVEGSNCGEPGFSVCLQFGGGSGCADHCTETCQSGVRTCLAGGGGAACAARCGTRVAGACQLPSLNSPDQVFQVCPDLRVTRLELACMNVLMNKQGLELTDQNINWAYSNCWVIANEGFDTAAPDLAKVIEQWLKARGLL
ncbi:MAG TPA: hypothetical protein VFS43_22130 [Polyangiaceae bacterium]|nr:hypothetical protein [Polyangiaceae bacterium]